MVYPKFSDLQQKLMDDLDLNEETFIQPSSFKNYYNEGVAFISSKIHTLYEDYFKTRVRRNVTAGQSTLDLPSNIYANKIRKIYWNGESREDRYEIKRIRDQEQVLFVDESDRYRYEMINDGETDDIPLGTQMNIYPNFRDTTENTPILIYYLRSANTYVNDDSVCDIPEFSDVVNQYVAYRCRKKEGHPLTQLEKDDLGEWISVMVETLKSRTPDENDELLKDMSFYTDFDPYFLLF